MVGSALFISITFCAALVTVSAKVFAPSSCHKLNERRNQSVPHLHSSFSVLHVFKWLDG